MPRCPLCEQQVESWIPHPQRSRQSPFTRAIGGVGSDLENYLCPSCQCNDRERHLWLYMAVSGILDESRGRAILHVAPEPAIEPRLRELAGASYVAGDLQPRRPGHRKIDVEALPFDDGHFHLIVCNHVLEHVATPQRAVAEMARCLADDGWLVAQTPYAPRLLRTFELEGASSPEASRLFFGQEDHVRLFGADIVDLFLGAGLQGRLVPHDEALPRFDARHWGCNPREPFFLFSKSRCPRFPS
ncbi:MAG TPA: class I SAM-dependent methyltransferase [Burkholderiaceae bacterium]|nr:class I SAM-dependent methyltransferase [Burkholderiaceae bacterium]